MSVSPSAAQSPTGGGTAGATPSVGGGTAGATPSVAPPAQKSQSANPTTAKAPAGSSTPPANLPPPIAHAGGPYTGTIGTAITFDGSRSGVVGASGTLVSYEWNFGDGTECTSVDAITPHIYTKPGPYPVSLKVIDDKGKTNDDTTTANINKKSNWCARCCQRLKLWQQILLALFAIVGGIFAILGPLGFFHNYPGGSGCKYDVECLSKQCVDNICACTRAHTSCADSDNKVCHFDSGKCVDREEMYGGEYCTLHKYCKSKRCDTTNLVCRCTDKDGIGNYCRDHDLFCKEELSTKCVNTTQVFATANNADALYEIEVFPVQPEDFMETRNFFDTDLLKFADVVAQLSQEYGPYKQAALENSFPESNILDPSKCAVQMHIINSTGAYMTTECDVKRQQVLKEERKVRLQFEVRWSSTYFNPEPYTTALPMHVNTNLSSFKQRLIDAGFGHSTHNEKINGIEKIVSLDKRDEFDRNTCLPKPPIEDLTREDIRFPSCPNCEPKLPPKPINLWATFRQEIILSTNNELNDLEKLILEQDFFGADYDLFSNRPPSVWRLLKEVPQCKITQQTLNSSSSEGATISLQYTMHWVYCGGIDFLYDKDVAKDFEEYINSWASVALVSEMNKAGLRNIVSIGNAILEDSWEEVELESYSCIQIGCDRLHTFCDYIHTNTTSLSPNMVSGGFMIASFIFLICCMCMCRAMLVGGQSEKEGYEMVNLNTIPEDDDEADEHEV